MRDAKTKPKTESKIKVLASFRGIVETLAEQIAENAPAIGVEVDQEALKNDVQNVVDQHLTGAAVSRPTYNLAGDLLCLAHDTAQKGDMRSALRFFASMLETEDLGALVEGISQMNADTEVADVATVAMAIENGDPTAEDEGFIDPEAESEEDELDDFASEEPIDSEEEDLGEDEDEEGADEIEDLAEEGEESVDDMIDSVLDEDDETVDDLGEDEAEASDEEDEDLGEDEESADDTEAYEELAEDEDGDHEFRGTEPLDEGEDEELEGDTDQDEDDESVPMGGASSVTASRAKPNKTAAFASVEDRIRAVMNKATMSGTVQSRRAARNLVKQK